MAKTYYCFLEKFNNYFNRKIIRLETLAEYITASNDYHIPVDANSAMIPFDFNPNDNVTTEIIGNDLPFSPDYFLQLDASQNILSRWFVVEEKRNRQGQWLYSLKRDVISDNVESLINSPVYVQKGIVGDDNPLILNSEGMNFNQIKVEETLLKDNTKSAWLVGYIAKSEGGADINVQVPSADITDAISLNTIATDVGVSESVLIDLLNFDGLNTYPTRFIKRFAIAYSFKGAVLGGQNAHYFRSDFSYQTAVDYYNASPSNPLFRVDDVGYNTQLGNRFRNAVIANKTALLSEILTIIGQTYYFTKDVDYPKIKAYEGKIIHYLGKYYRFHIVEVGSNNIAHDKNFAYTKYTSLQTIATATASGASWVSIGTGGRYDLFQSNADKVYLQMQEITDSSVIPLAEAKISSNRKVTEGQQFDIIALPADPLEITFENNGNTISFNSNPDIARRIISQLALEEDANVYDIQLLPYCPASSPQDVTGLTEGEDFDYISVGQSNLTFNGYSGDAFSNVVTPIDAHNYNVVLQFYVETESSKAVTVDSASVVISANNEHDYSGGEITNVSATVNDATGVLTVSFDYAEGPAQEVSGVPYTDVSIQYSYAGESKVGVVFYIQNASFQTILNYQLGLKDSMKVDSQCDMYRLMSPNYQGTFEFNVAKNGGSVDYFTAYCTYKPYTPFIKVCPAFNFVYGMDYNDNRGLICGGDFSLPRISSAWQSYQLNNKNYQNIFNRDIQNLDVMQSIEARQQYITGGIGIATDSMKGAIAGGMVGGGWGAVAGGVIGAGVSGVGYGVDISIMQQQQQEARSYAVDKYNFQLGNIKALPYTLTKVGSFDISSKIFPVLEYYTCSEQEKEALRNKIKYESMTIMAIAKFGDFYQAFEELTYFKGVLIRCDDIADDTHVLDAIYAELFKGVYM